MGRSNSSRQLIGDMVLATDPTTGETSARAVTELIIGKGSKNLVELTIDTDGDGKGQVITATDQHPIWSTNRRAWVNAVDLNISDKLRTAAGLTGRIRLLVLERGGAVSRGSWPRHAVVSYDIS